MTTDIMCEHGTVLAAWCGDCATDWVPAVEPEPAEAGQDQPAA